MVQGDNLAVKGSVLTFELAGDFLREMPEGYEGVSVSRHQLTLAALEVREGSEAIEFRLEDPIGMIKRPRTANKPHGFTLQTHGAEYTSPMLEHPATQYLHNNPAAYWCPHGGSLSTVRTWWSR